jgi:aspartate/methionine/tyrosine aminotransferase
MRDAIRDLPGSRIREVANAGLGRDDVLAFWFGESDEVTSPAVREAAALSLTRGETFYSHNLGLAELRAAIAGYTETLHPAVGIDRIAITSSGVSALMLAMQMLAGAGDEVAAVVPVWPNLTAQPAILGANVKRVPRRTTRPAGRWRATSSKRSSTTAAAPAPGSWPMRCTSGCGSKRAAVRRRSWTWRMRTTVLWWSTASRSLS